MASASDAPKVENLLYIRSAALRRRRTQTLRCLDIWNSSIVGVRLQDATNIHAG